MQDIRAIILWLVLVEIGRSYPKRAPSILYGLISIENNWKEIELFYAGMDKTNKRILYS